MEYFRLYVEFYKIRLKSIAEYRGSFLMTSFSKALSYAADFVMIGIMIGAFQRMGEWSAWEVLFLYGLNSGAYALAGSFFYHITTYLPQRIRDGTFDEVLTKPLNPFVYLASRYFSTGYFGTFSISLFILILSLVRLGTPMNAVKILFLAVTLLSGGLITGSMMLIPAVPSFWMIDSSGLRRLFFGDLRSFVEYPITIFGKAIQVLLTIVLPYAFINFYPAQYILGKRDFPVFPPFFMYLSPAVALALFALAYAFWCYGLRRYESSGS